MRGAGGRTAASGCGTASPKKDEGRAAELRQGDMRGLFRRRKRSGAIQAEAVCAGLAPEANLKVAERGEGRAERPAWIVSTVATKQAARCKGTSNLNNYFWCTLSRAESQRHIDCF